MRYTTAHPARLFEARVGLLSDCFHFALPARRAKYGDHSSWQLRALVYFWKSLSCAALRRSFDVARPRTNDMHRHSLKLALQGDKESLAHIRQQQAEEGSDEIQSFNERLRSQLCAHLLDMEAAKSKSLWGFLRVSSRRFFSVFLKLFDAGHAGLSNKIFLIVMRNFLVTVRFGVCQSRSVTNEQWSAQEQTCRSVWVKTCLFSRKPGLPV